MNMIEATKVCFSKYVTFSGRARRAEYWWFILATMIVSIVLTIIDMGVFGSELGLLSTVWSLAVFLPSLAVASRRLHDTDRSAWWLLIMLIPVIGAIVLIVFLATRGTEGGNRFGADPLRGDRAGVFN
jgi:uncharacterized membrane protein YhaH (DUF805 family)